MSSNPLPSKYLTSNHEQNPVPAKLPPVQHHYNFLELSEHFPELKQYLIQSEDSKTVGEPTSHHYAFFKPGATLALTKAILAHHFRLSLSLPDGHLVPTVPSRQLYLTWALQLLDRHAHTLDTHSSVTLSQQQPHHRPQPMTLLDIGTGPSSIYCLLAARLLPSSWSFVGTDVDLDAVNHALANVEKNLLSHRIRILHRNPEDPLVPHRDTFHSPLALTVCNPPFYHEGSTPAGPRPRPGTVTQMETCGGEIAFIQRIARDSKATPDTWFTTLVGVKSDLKKLVQFLRSPAIGATQVLTTDLNPGGRTLRWAAAWRFGSHRTTVSNLGETTGSKWRRTFAVRPAGRHTSSMGTGQFEKVLVAACSKIGWTKISSNPTRPGVDICDDAGRMLQVVTSTAPSGVGFHVSVKALSDTGIHDETIANFVDCLSDEIIALLDAF